MIDLKNLVFRRKAKWDVQVLINLLARMKQRIHNEGKDRFGALISPKYSSGWGKVRRDNGRQIGYVDLEFMGDLRRDFQLGTKANGEFVLGVTQEISNLKILGNEARYKKEIYTPSDGEVDNLVEVYTDNIIELFGEIFNGIGKNLKDGSSS
jgi:hypothetical protein